MRKIIFYIVISLFFSSCISQKKITKRSNINSVIGEARTYIGTPYQWGGNDKNGIDCSGLLVRSFESIGMKIPRTTSQQIDIGKKVSLKKSREGDLVFFAFGKSKRKVTHVGLVSKHNTSSDINNSVLSTGLSITFKPSFFASSITLERVIPSRIS